MAVRINQAYGEANVYSIARVQGVLGSGDSGLLRHAGRLPDKLRRFRRQSIRKTPLSVRTAHQRRSQLARRQAPQMAPDSFDPSSRRWAVIAESSILRQGGCAIMRISAIWLKFLLDYMLLLR